MANMFAMTLARYRVDPEIKRKGLLHLPPLVVFVSVDVSLWFLILVDISN